MDRQIAVLAAVVLLVAVAARLGYIHFRPVVYRRGWGCYGDTFVYLTLAKNLVKGRGFSQAGREPYTPSAYKPPGYPFFLMHLILSGFSSLHGLRLVQGFLDSFSALFVFACAWWITRRKSDAFLAGLLTALSPYNIHYTRGLLSDWMGSTLVTAFLAALYLAVRRRNLWLVAGAGAVMGMTALTRPAMLIFPVLASAWVALIWAGSWRKRLARTVLFLVATYGFVGLWTTRNYVVFRRWLPVSAGGMSVGMLRGTWETEANWSWTEIPREYFETDAEWRSVVARVERYRYVTGLGIMDEIFTLNAWFKAKARERIRANPMRYVRLCIGRIPILWWNHSIGMYAEPDPGGRFVFVWLIGAAVGLPFTRKEARWLLLLWSIPVYLTFLHMPAHCEPRFTLPAIPALSILAGIGYAHLARKALLTGRARRDEKQGNDPGPGQSPQ